MIEQVRGLLGVITSSLRRGFSALEGEVFEEGVFALSTWSMAWEDFRGGVFLFLGKAFFSRTWGKVGECWIEILHTHPCFYSLLSSFCRF